MKRTMLIVDDAKLNREILADLFREDFRIIKAENGRKALEIIKECKGQIDIVMLDLVMPEISGFDVLKERKSIPYFCEIPVIVITGCGAMEDQVKAFELGASDYVTKPFEAEIVISRVKSVTEAHQRMLAVVSEAKKLKQKSEIDQMTGLLNKTTSEQMIENICKKDDNRTNVLMIIDIDNFKSVNDLLGHQTGDHVICVIANLLSGMFRTNDIVGRIGGDEFIALMVDVPDMDIVHKKLDQMMQIMRDKTNLTIPDNVSLSIGVASDCGEMMSYKQLFERADSALLRAKENGKACYCEYGAEEIKIQNAQQVRILLISANRNVRSAVHALIPDTIDVLDMTLQQAEELGKQEESRQFSLIYLDVSACKDSGKEIWERMLLCDWFSTKRVIAICKEGELTQYAAAIEHGVLDLFTAPIDAEAFKRRTNIHLNK